MRATRANSELSWSSKWTLLPSEFSHKQTCTFFIWKRSLWPVSDSMLERERNPLGPKWIRLILLPSSLVSMLASLAFSYFTGTSCFISCYPSFQSGRSVKFGLPAERESNKLSCSWTIHRSCFNWPAKGNFDGHTHKKLDFYSLVPGAHNL